MRDLPSWLIKTLDKEDLSCHGCKEELGPSHVQACGIRNSFKDPKNEVLYLELNCSSCEELTIFEIQDMSLVELSFEIIEEIESQEKINPANKMSDIDSLDDDDAMNNIYKNKIKKRTRKRRSKITHKEVKESIKFLNNVKSHDEFLIAMGMSPEEIDSFKLKKNNDK